MTPSTSRTRLGLDQRRAQLIELGRALFNARAYDEISIDDIAEAAGISKGLLYHYFPSKRSFYVATVRAGAAQLTALTEEAEGFPVAERLVRGLDAYIAYVDANASSYATLLRSGIGSDAEVAGIVEETRRVLIGQIARGLGATPPTPAVSLALRAWIGFVEGASLEWIDHRGVSRDDLRTLLITALQSAVASAATLEGHAGQQPRATRRAHAPTGARRTTVHGRR